MPCEGAITQGHRAVLNADFKIPGPIRLACCHEWGRVQSGHSTPRRDSGRVGLLWALNPTEAAESPSGSRKQPFASTGLAYSRRP